MLGQDSSDQAEPVAVDAVWKALGGSLVALQERGAASYTLGHTDRSATCCCLVRGVQQSGAEVWGAAVSSRMP